MQTLQDHQETHHFSRTATLTSSAARKKYYYYQKKTRPVEQAPQYRCDKCGRTFLRLYHYDIHQRKHFPDLELACIKVDKDEGKSYACKICQNVFETKNQFKNHQLRHKEKAFLCSECGKGFITSAALRSHSKASSNPSSICRSLAVR